MSGAWRTLSAGALAFQTGLGIPFTHTTSCGLWNQQEGSQVREVNSDMTAASSPLTALEVTRNAATLFPRVRGSNKVEMAIPWPQRPKGNWLSVSNPILTSFIVQANLIVCAHAKSFQCGKSSYKSPDGPAQSRLKSGDFWPEMNNMTLLLRWLLSRESGGRLPPDLGGGEDNWGSSWLFEMNTAPERSKCDSSGRTERAWK